MSPPPATAVTEADLAAYLDARGQRPPPLVTRLTGGVSGETHLIEWAPTRLVVKRALDRLLVEGEWHAKPERAMTEAAAMALLHELTPDHTPAMLDADPARNTIVMTAAPPDWVPWKSVLMGDLPDPTSGPIATAAALGRILGDWHARTCGDADVAARFDDDEAFDQLRVSPFHRVVAEAHPSVADAIRRCIDELEQRRDCLVHGDYSPKNVLVGPDGLMVLDFEVAHVGAAIFDLAFMSCHLALKAMHRPAHAALLADAGSALVDAYRTKVPDGFGADPASGLTTHTACLLLARVDGLSPATYLDGPTADAVRELALSLLSRPPGETDLWAAVRAAAGRLA
jgi:5-methylthioribose kinase